MVTLVGYAIDAKSPRYHSKFVFEFVSLTMLCSPNDAHYRVKLEWENLHWIASPRSVLLTHQKGGPRFPIDCREFVAASPDQIRIHWKDKERWPWMETTAFGLEKRDVNLDVYISEFSDFYLVEARRDGSYIGEILNLVKSHSKGPLVELALKLWAANRLLMEGWQLEGEDLLEMPVVKQSDCPLYNKVPVPRVLENQLDRHLESHIVNIEGRLLKMLQNALLQKSNSDPIDIFLSVTMILHVVERDIWRLLWWWYHEEQDYKWRHPSTPVYLIERNIQFTKLLLAHIRCARLIPDDFVLQLGRFRTQLQGGEKAHARYNEIKEDSLDSTLSSLAIVKDIKVVAELDDFVYRTSEVTGTIVA
ncbi:hypothetical protein F5884DRAFT_112259 [Xylogone sp. PMI_703]|nr:hypothetical protein F5884DRAFT_112259 [Xylogone sp. PMI_703]